MDREYRFQLISRDLKLESGQHDARWTGDGQ
ncbi:MULTISPECIES: tetrahydromethanopterin S-methyltransferase subunit F [unclassified Anabaena]